MSAPVSITALRDAARTQNEDFLTTFTVADLRMIAQELSLPGRSAMIKASLIKAIYASLRSVSVDVVPVFLAPVTPYRPGTAKRKMSASSRRARTGWSK